MGRTNGVVNFSLVPWILAQGSNSKKRKFDFLSSSSFFRSADNDTFAPCNHSKDGGGGKKKRPVHDGIEVMQSCSGEEEEISPRECTACV